ncbi:hypothetical protein C8R45DRAFT_485548 [Mycena sanguinolenta]|nr:hypothetical protein C8R45DRAFT_485548 [Mycena sanguinolenta]
MPWAQLTDLTLSCDSPLVALDVLAQCSNLTRGVVSTAGWDELPSTNRELVSLSHLQHLSLPFLASAGDVTPFFDYLSAPALEELCLDFWEIYPDDEYWTDSSRLTAFGLRSPNLTRLELTEMRYSSFRSDDVLAALRCMVHLTHLRMTEHSDECFDDIVIGALTYHDGATPLIPRLHDFVFETAYEINFTEDTLVEMVTSRWKGAELASDSNPSVVARWTRVELWADFTEHFTDMMTLQKDRGLPIEF